MYCEKYGSTCERPWNSPLVIAKVTASHLSLPSPPPLPPVLESQGAGRSGNSLTFMSRVCIPHTRAQPRTNNATVPERNAKRRLWVAFRSARGAPSLLVLVPAITQTHRYTAPARYSAIKNSPCLSAGSCVPPCHRKPTHRWYARIPTVWSVIPTLIFIHFLSHTVYGQPEPRQF